MTADKQVIIDGVDVIGCKNFRPDVDTSEDSYINACSIGLWQRGYSNLEPICIMACRCRDNPNCDYKQLKRKEQKLARIKEILEIHKDCKCAICPKFEECFEQPSCDRVILQIIEGKENE